MQCLRIKTITEKDYWLQNNKLRNVLVLYKYVRYYIQSLKNQNSLLFRLAVNKKIIVFKV